MILDVLTCNDSYHHFEDTNESKLLIDIQDGKLSIFRKYNDDESQRLTFYPPGTWISLHVSHKE